MKIIIIMSIIGNVFSFLGCSANNKQNSEPQLPEYKPDWDFYMSNVDNVIGSIYVDLGLIQVAPLADKPNVAWVSILMNNPREDGLSSNEESDFLFEIEDNLVADILKNHNSVYVGRLTSNNERSLYFYFGDTNSYEKTIKQVMSKFPDYKYDIGYKEDKEWGGYIDFLYPNPRQYQIIMNDRVIRNLEKSGDNLTSERMVDHWIYFKNKSDMGKYIAEVSKMNFQVLSEKKTGKSEFALNIRRVDKVDLQSVNEYVLYLWELAGKYNGNYDGWGCEVEK